MGGCGDVEVVGRGFLRSRFVGGVIFFEVW